MSDLTHDDRDEDLALASRLGRDWLLTIADPATAACLAAAGHSGALLIRNAWPSRQHEHPFLILESLVQAGTLRAYNPPSLSRGYREDKRYLADRHRQCLAGIPTWTERREMEAIVGPDASAVFKPIDGCSSAGVEFGPVGTLPASGGIYQPLVTFEHEVSMFYIDDVFSHALRTGGCDLADRWELVAFEPSAGDLEWGATIVAENALPYGIQRIDGLRSPDGKLLLNEIEDFMPFLSLEVLTEDKRVSVVEALAASILARMGSA